MDSVVFGDLHIICNGRYTQLVPWYFCVIVNIHYALQPAYLFLLICLLFYVPYRLLFYRKPTPQIAPAVQSPQPSSSTNVANHPTAATNPAQPQIWTYTWMEDLEAAT
jgi:hypothetical protein